jgi:hypothetical protein
LRRLNAIPDYRRLFGQIFSQVRRDRFGRASAEFEFSLTFANNAITRAQTAMAAR